MKYTVNNYYTITHPEKKHFVGCELEDVRYVKHDDRYVGRVAGERFSRQFTREELDIEETKLAPGMVEVTLKHWHDEETGRTGWDIYHAGRRDSIKEPQLLSFILPRHEEEWFEKPQPYTIKEKLLQGLIHKNTGQQIIRDNPRCFEPVKINHSQYASVA